ncbi:long-chain fatty acid--CoA ligase [Patescibacteria group bacterium]|nr:long-chain fatty acid--CoA ligase [Patescibacteria group bacterium]
MKKSIAEQFNETAERFAKRPALKFKYHDAYISISFGQLQSRVTKMAKGLRELGIIKDDKVAILSENRSEWVRTDLATLTLGAVSVPIHTTLSPKIIKHILNDSSTKVLLVSNQEQFNKVMLIIDELSDLQVIIYINLDHKPDDKINKKILSLEEVMKLGRQSTKEILVEVKPDDLASIVYTSGTTALPKGVMLTHRNFLFNAEAAVTVTPVDENDILLSFLPLSHVLERTVGYYAPLICRGCCIAYAESIKTLSANLKEVKPTILIAIPRIFEKIHSGIWDKLKEGSQFKYKLFLWALKKEPGTLQYWLADILVFHKIRAAFGGRLRLTISGGATLNHKLARFFARIGIIIVEGYGLTETSPIVTANRQDNVKFGTVGQQLPGVEIKIAPDKEILVKGPNVMAGYYKNEAMTKEVIDTDGWFHTGDLGFLSSEGFLVIIGRKKEMISMSSGKIAWPESLELVLNNDRFISQSMVYGNDKSYLVALIIPDWQEVARNLDKLGVSSKEPDQLIQEPKLAEVFQKRLDKINEQFADWEKIRKFIFLTREFSAQKDEVTPTLKLRRKIIESNYKKGIEKMYLK